MNFNSWVLFALSKWIQIKPKMMKEKKKISEKERTEPEEEIMNEKVPNMELWQTPSKEIIPTTFTPELHVVELYPFTVKTLVNHENE